MRRKVTRLFEQFRPEHYQLELQLDTEAMKFHGTVTINGQKTGRPSKRLTFHQNGLKITAASVIRHDKKGEQKFSVDRINHHGSFDEVRLHTKEKLFPGKFSVQIAFSGNITKPMNGIYPCFFKHDGQDKKLIATQFESHHAARCSHALTSRKPKLPMILFSQPPPEIQYLPILQLKNRQLSIARLQPSCKRQRLKLRRRCQRIFWHLYMVIYDIKRPVLKTEW
jgi:hypothetical protein